MKSVEPRLVRFGPFELDPVTGELRKQGIRIRLQPKPLEILRALVENPGAVVTRDELRARLWPEDTFVDFESGVNTAVNRLRIALGDSAEHPRYIETMSRAGYRFIAPLAAGTLAAPIPALPPAASPAIPARRPRALTLAAVGGCVALAVAAAAMVRLRPDTHPMRFRQVTFRRGQVGGARFSPGKDEIVYSARWDDEPRQTYLTNPADAASRPLGFEGLGLVAMSKSGELALMEGGGTMNITGGTLSRAAIAGGPSQFVGRNIFGADWNADGTQMALVRVVAGAQQIEFPIGTILYRTAGWISNVRVSPDSRQIAFIEHPVRHDDAGAVKTIDLTGQARTLSAGWANASGVAWNRNGEVWFTATRDASPRSVWAVSTNGHLRPVGQAPGILTLRDIAPDGKLLVTVESRRLEIAGRIEGDARERSLSLTDWSRVQQLSADGGTLLFDESGEGAGEHTLSYVRRTRTGEIVRLGEGVAQGLTPDDSAAILLSEDRKHLRQMPISGGGARELTASGFLYQWARPFPTGDRLLALANPPGQPLGLYVQTIADGKAVPLAVPMTVRNSAIAPDGSQVAVLTPEGRLTIYPTAGGAARVIPSSEPLAPVRWTRDGQWLFVQHLRASVQTACDVSRVRIATGEIELWKRIKPSDPTGVNSITGVVIAGDEESYAYSYRRVLSDLFIAEGWK
jgi:DNA-binding winged helix-turn-helix (wHTH) protein